MLSFFVAGEPKAQPRPKAARIGGFIRIYTPTTAKKWKEAVAKVAASFAKKMKFTGPLRVDLDFQFKRPKSHFTSKGVLKPSAPKYHTKKPDKDNLEKAVTDAITGVGLWEDDSQLCQGATAKRYSDTEGVYVEITELQ